MVPSKHLSNFLRNLEMPWKNCGINLALNWSKNCVIFSTVVTVKATIFSITDTKLYVPVVTLSTQDNPKLLEEFKSGFERTINWIKYEPKVTVQQQNRYLDLLINPSFQGVNRLLVYQLKELMVEPVTIDIIFH